jgi:hypothetical protein
MLQRQLRGNSTLAKRTCRQKPAKRKSAGFVVNNAVFYAATITREEPVEHSSAYWQPILKEVAQSIWQPPKIS